jgi:hypothetical protein
MMANSPALIILRSWPIANWDCVDHGGKHIERYDESCNEER